MHSDIYEIKDWVVRIHRPPGLPPFPVILMLHGFSGDETSMWVFASQLPSSALIIAPRGLYPTLIGGYNWVNRQEHSLATLEEFNSSVESMNQLLTRNNFPDGDFSKMRMVGFSQGTAFMFAYGMNHPERVTALAGLSGFFPDLSDKRVASRPFADKKVFMAHGTRDELVPIERARAAVSLLELAGAEVSYCEYDMGHKLGAACFKSMGVWFKQTEMG